MRAGAVVLRPLVRSDGPEWFRIRQRDAEWLQPWEATRPPGSLERVPSFPQMVARNRRLAKVPVALPWAIVWDDGWPRSPARHPEKLAVIGQLTVSSITYGSALSASMGYWVSHRYAGRGVVPTAVALAADYCFQVLRLHRIEICIRPENAKSLRVVEKLGLVEEGMRPRYLHIDGQWSDHRVFRLLCDDRPAGVLQEYLASHVLPGSPLT
ncbi:GNAT family N-acetyltransferase [Acidipropionibacterium jensenii]|uniref:N-acetyltransferase n=1 Tax=Acidipropionibacterium jensenii TaxID=1749 RepID=A0A3T0S3A0_9ACTN|nr:GNAT family protein [Acidipropionibacterium jensenii]MDN6618063.1 GNAT family N-acetyltransferase [Corynebacterium variabile]AZZ40833.1 N-acetyltransferase [Acidipropionibacterium jensenii]AZZ43238.1 N-acetyltransferase [Acidipropionibacterium jensenii]MDN5978052.1 GNAT family N-acetyltransferase [Acidipropionibacterium jensenii]MDN5996532.1 GNAT family N-acetyltransferase [Acidipropionibacterium jensenii]